ncbi:MAG TPA: hypothetical protein VMJ65_00845 [Solirubrobacteraceae bacterium]|nr:hypothetical protein [Solirubrobacteraceae bacterium]
MVVREPGSHIGAGFDSRVDIDAGLHPGVENRRARLRQMDSERRRVTLSGDLAGNYVVVEERPDGSLVVAPDPTRRSGGTRRQPEPEGVWSLFSGLLTRPPSTPPNVPEILERWGVELSDDEGISDFMIAEIDGQTGFLAVTTQRFIFAAGSGKALRVVQEHLLSAARNVEVVGRKRRAKLHVTWHGSESVIEVLDRDALPRLYETLAGHGIS